MLESVARTVPVGYRAFRESGQVRCDCLRVSQWCDAAVQVVRDDEKWVWVPWPSLLTGIESCSKKCHDATIPEAGLFIGP